MNSDPELVVEPDLPEGVERTDDVGRVAFTVERVTRVCLFEAWPGVLGGGKSLFLRCVLVLSFWGFWGGGD